MNVGVFHPGTQHSWQTALALQDQDRLAWYATSIFYQPDKFPYRLEKMVPPAIGRRLHAEFRRFSHPRLNTDLVYTTGMMEWLERIAARAGARALAKKIDRLGNRKFVDRLAGKIRSNDPFALWGYSSSSLKTFELGKAMGRPCILDRTNGDFKIYNATMQAVQAQYGEWFLSAEKTVPQSVIDSDRREYELADVVLVGSHFARQTIVDSTGDAEIARKTRVLNYCYDEALFEQQPVPTPVTRDEPVRFLFVGQVSPRKGIHHVLEAFARLPASAATLTIVGPMMVAAEAFGRYADRVTYIPTVARSDIPRIMRDHHALLFPSYFEGSALSLLEALASGLALIQTPSSGNGVTADTGLLLDRPDTDLVHGALLTAIEDRDRLNHWRAHAQQEARNYTFARYRDNIAALLADMNI